MNLLQHVTSSGADRKYSGGHWQGWTWLGRQMRWLRSEIAPPTASAVKRKGDHKDLLLALSAWSCQVVWG